MKAEGLRIGGKDMTVNAARQILMDCIEDYKIYMKSPQYRKRMRSHPLKGRQIINIIRGKAEA